MYIVYNPAYTAEYWIYEHETDARRKHAKLFKEGVQMKIKVCTEEEADSWINSHP